MFDALACSELHGFGFGPGFHLLLKPVVTTVAPTINSISRKQVDSGVSHPAAMPNTDANMDGDSGGSHPTALQPQVVQLAVPRLQDGDSGGSHPTALQPRVVQLALPRWQVQHGNFWWDIQ